MLWYVYALRHGVPPYNDVIWDSAQPPLLVSRFIMNLREASDVSGSRTLTAYPGGDLATMSAPEFATPHSFVGNIGGYLDYDLYTDVTASGTDSSMNTRVNEDNNAEVPDVDVYPMTTMGDSTQVRFISLLSIIFQLI